METWGWLGLGAAGAAGLIGMMWGHFAKIFHQLTSRFILTFDVRSELFGAVQLYCWNYFSPSWWGVRSYSGTTVFLRPRQRHQLVAMELIGNKGKLFWWGWRPVWIGTQHASDRQVSSGESEIPAGLQITVLRGTLDPDTFLYKCAEHYNKVFTGQSDETGTRHWVRHIMGTVGKRQATNALHETESKAPSVNIGERFRHARLLGWDYEDVGRRHSQGRALDYLALDANALNMVSEVQHWYGKESWFRERGVPWHRGWLLHGPPGTGKTSLVRALAEDLDLPIFSFDVGSLYNDEFQEAWARMLGHTPCVALIEDLDTVFNGRENLRGEGLTFDCLLNCLDGILRVDGLLLIVTTNAPEKLDPSLGIENSQTGSTRPGRIDRTLRMGGLEKEGREKLARRILPDQLAAQQELIEVGDGDTGAQFQERCVQKALQIYRQEEGEAEC